ncbi:MAG: ferredoxin [Woeseiaceae bacterium]|nr:ferredoxin [Woeseiaceae bacterium]NIP19973.1 ferredoxin [Woeseiaceae bacterium]NIS88769.1 ferredoxin [Woeseiaceae bacterium]
MNFALESKREAPEASGNERDVSAGTISRLRRFHFGEPAAAASLDRPADTVLPALLNAYRDASAIRYQYPLYLVPIGDEAHSVLAKPASEHFMESLETFAPAAEDARILKDNLPWIERYLRQKLDGSDPVDAVAMFAEAAAAMQEHLDLGSQNREKLDADLGKLQGAIAAGGQFLGYGPSVSLHLMLHAIRHRQGRQRELLHKEIDTRINGLQALLDVEKAKSTDANEPASIKTSVGLGSRYIDSGALSGMLEHRSHGSVEMPEERRARIERALQALQNWSDDAVLVRFVGRVDDPWFAEVPDLQLVASDDPCTEAARVFASDAAEFAGLFAALRIAALEIEGNYDPAVHDSWFAGFDWQAFTNDELQLVTRVVALVSADYLAGDGLPSFSQLLGSRLPVHVLSWIRAYDNPAAKPGEDPFDSYRFELGYLGIGHRQVVVAQTSAARYHDLLSGFLCALDSNRTSLHLINRGTQTKTKKPLLEAWFVASAALESRAHPFVLVNPDAGDRAAERVSFGGNPQAEADWPVEKLEYQAADGEVTEMDLAFTFADYALLMPALHEHFRVVPVGVESDDLIPVDRYLDVDDELADRAVPFIWAIDDQGVLMRLVVSRALVFACRDRLNYWRSLQELAGIQNFYVEEAIERIVEEQRAAIEAEREQLKKEHEEQLETVRSEAAGEAMGQLVDVLMGADLSGMIAGGAPLATMPAAAPAEIESPPEEVEAEPEPVAEEEPEEELSFDEPWLDTAMCTTCDDCMGINKMMFAYNDDKQAIITDPRAGPYADLVAAAEICPAKCIHPGKPLDPNEPGLDELIARAEPFN